MWKTIRSFFKPRRELVFENLALRQQLVVLKQQSKRPRLRNRDRVFWIALKRLWPTWRGALHIVQPETVIAWQRKGFRAYWRLKSRNKGGRPRIAPELRKLIVNMWQPNPTWGKPRIQAELAKPGISVSDKGGLEIQAQDSRATIAILEDLSDKPHGPRLLDGFSYGSHCHLWFALRASHSVPRTSRNRASQCGQITQCRWASRNRNAASPQDINDFKVDELVASKGLVQDGYHHPTRRGACPQEDATQGTIRTHGHFSSESLNPQERKGQGVAFLDTERNL